MKTMNATAPINPAGTPETQTDAEGRNIRDFVRLASLSTAIGCGYVAATVEALHGGPAGVSIKLNAGTFAAFAFGSAIGYLYWQFAGRDRRLARWSSIALGVAAVAAFLY